MMARYFTASRASSRLAVQRGDEIGGLDGRQGADVGEVAAAQQIVAAAARMLAVSA